jgi:hypothetical protein
MISAQASPQPDPSAADPAADPAESGGAAARAADLRDLDEISAMALALLRALHVETLDPWNSPTCLPGERVRAGDPPMAYCRLTRTVRVNLAVRARMVEGGPEGTGAAAMARQEQIRMVSESSAIGMDLLRALHQEVVDPDNAPTARQGRRVGAGDPALALSRISRMIRLNHAIKAKIIDGTLGRRRQSRRGNPDAPDQDSAAQRDPARQQAAAALGPAGASAADRHQETAEPPVETDGIETETEDLFGELDEDFEDEDEFADLDRLTPEERMALVRRDFARCFKGKARVPGISVPDEPSGLDEPPGGDEPPGRGRPRDAAGQTADPPSTAAMSRPAGLQVWFELGAAAGAPGDASGDASGGSTPSGRGHDPP